LVAKSSKSLCVFPLAFISCTFVRCSPPHPILHLILTNCRIIVFDKKVHRRRAPKGSIFLYH
jgi:hypothetical protein